MGGQGHVPAVLPCERDSVPNAQDAGWAVGLVWTGAENMATHGFDRRTPHSEVSRYTDCSKPTKADLLILNKTGKVRIT